MKSKRKSIEQIAPRWARFLKKYGAEKIYGAVRLTEARSKGRGIPLLSIGDSRYCIIGEAWGFTDNYVTYNHRGCPTCEGLSFRLCTNEQWQLDKYLAEFVEHWNTVHLEKQK